MSTEKYIIQHTVCTCHFALLSKQNCVTAFCLIATPVIFFFFKYHMPLDRRANDMLMGDECSCQFIVGFLVWNERSVLGDSLDSLGSPRHPPPPLLILLTAVRLNGQNPQADWYIVLVGETWRAPPSLIPSPLLPNPPSPSPPSHPHELPRWQVINPYRHGRGGIRLGREGDEDDWGGSVAATQTWRRFLLMHRKLFPPHRQCLPRGFATANSLHAK